MTGPAIQEDENAGIGLGRLSGSDRARVGAQQAGKTQAEQADTTHLQHLPAGDSQRALALCHELTPRSGIIRQELHKLQVALHCIIKLLVRRPKVASLEFG